MSDTLLLDRDELAKLLSVSKSSVDRMRREGILPAPVRLRAKPLWRRSDIEAAIRDMPVAKAAGA